MANHKATKKDVRQSAKRRERNRYYGKTTRNAIRDLRTVTDANAAGEQLPEIASMIDKLAKRGVIHKNKASNLRSEEHTSELQSQSNLVCRLLLEKKKKN